jgi:hypothetical protein
MINFTSSGVHSWTLVIPNNETPTTGTICFDIGPINLSSDIQVVALSICIVLYLDWYSAVSIAGTPYNALELAQQ